MRFRLKNRIIGLALLAALLPVLVMSILLYTQRVKLKGVVEDEIDVLTNANIAQISLDVYHMCEVANDLIQQKVNYDLNVAKKIMLDMGVASLSTLDVSWKATNQFTKETLAVDLPEMTMGGIWLGHNTSLKVGTPVVDEVKRLVGGTCTIFQRMNEDGDMLRVATNVVKLDHTRAIGTYIPAFNPDRSPNPVISAVMKGKTFRGRAYVVNAYYITAYEPIRNSKGDIIGVLYVGVKQESVKSIRKAIMDVKVGQTGYVWIIGGREDKKGIYIISRKGERDGENIWNSRDAEGNSFIKDVVEKALELETGGVAYQSYLWKNPGDKGSRRKISAVTYFEPWDWIIGAGTYEDDYYDTRRKVEGTFYRLQWVMLFTGLVVLLIVGGLAFIMGTKIAMPITRITEIAKQIAKGDLSSAASSVRSLAGDKLFGKMAPDDETGNLLAAVKGMTESLNALVGQVQRSGIQVTSSSTQLAASAKEQESTMMVQVESTDKVVKSTEEISEVVTGLVETMHEVASMSQKTAGFAASGQSDLTRMEDAMHYMEDASKSISGRLSTINEKADNITNVVTTITKVADQTNLLSLNAAIEAEKAGEYGRGFNVVAREIRRLADQTAVATLDIDQMVQGMQSAVSAGVMEMDKFIADVKHSAEDVGKISAQLTRIIEEVQALSPRFDDIDVAMDHQSENSREISVEMGRLSDEMQQTMTALRETYSAIEQLNEAATGLQDEVSRFKVS